MKAALCLEGAFALSSTTAVQGIGILRKASVGIFPDLGNFQTSSISQTHAKEHRETERARAIEIYEISIL